MPRLSVRRRERIEIAWTDSDWSRQRTEVAEFERVGRGRWQLLRRYSRQIWVEELEKVRRRSGVVRDCYWWRRFHDDGSEID